MNGVVHAALTGKTGHEYIPGRGASGGLAGARNLKIIHNQKPTPTSPRTTCVSG